MTGYSTTASSRASTSTPQAVTLLRTVLVWPIVSLVLTGSWHLAIEAVWPDLRNTFVPAVIGPILLVYGAWVGYRTVTVGGSYLLAVGAGVVVGLLPLALDVVGFGILLGRGVDAGILAGVFGLIMVLFGALIGAGFAVSRPSAGA